MWHKKTASSSILAFVLFCPWISYTSSQGGPPVIITQPSDVVVKKNSPADLKCGVSEPSKTTVYWLHNGALVEDDGKRVTEKDGNLHFVRVIRNRKQTHAGIYQCVASNRYGTVKSRNASLIVGTFKSTFRFEPRNQSVFTGDTVVLRCSPPKGRPSPTVSWSHDGKLISNSSRTLISTKGNLTISSVTKADQGSYVCKAIHPLGTRNSQQAFLTVKEYVNPLTVVPPKQIAFTGNSTVFQCHYKGGAQDEVTWEKKDGVLPSGRHAIDNGQLTITDIDFKDEGTYICKARSGSRGLTVEATLDVQSKAKIMQGPKDVIAYEGNSTKFSCVAYGDPQPTVFWQMKGQTSRPLFPSENYLGRFFVSRSGELQIIDIRKDDEGVYICMALSLNSMTQAKAQLTVIGPKDVVPSVVSGPTKQSVYEGANVQFSCEVNGDPRPSVTWLRHIDASPLQNSSSVLITQSGQTFHLSIFNVSLDDQGRFKCVASSKFGTDSKEAELVVKKVIITTTSPPTTTPTTEPTLAPLELEATAATHDTVSLVWSSVSLADSSNVMYVVEYRKSNSNEQWETTVNSLKDNKYTVHNLDPDTTYIFNVKAVDQNGNVLTQGSKQVSKKTSKKPVVVIDHTPSLYPSDNVQIDVSPLPTGSDRINISWTLSRPASVSSVVIFWKKKDSSKLNHNKVTALSTPWYLLTGLEANTSYAVQVQVMSDGISIPISDPVFATTHAKSGIPMGGGTGVHIATTTDSAPPGGEVSVVEAQAEAGDTWYKMKLFVRQPWFIATMGAVAWIILLIIVVLLYRQRRNKRKAKSPTKVFVPASSENGPRSPTTRTSKFLWMEERNSDIPQQLSNNHSSNSSVSDCTRQVANCCGGGRGGSCSNGSLDFTNKVTLNHLSGSSNRMEANNYIGQGKTNNLPNSLNRYHEHVNKSNKFVDSPAGSCGTPNGTRSPSDSTLPMSGPRERLRYYDHSFDSGSNRSKSSSGSRKRDPNQTPSEASDTEKTKPKLKIQSFEMAGNLHTASTFHSEPPPTYEAVLKETEMEMKKFPLDGAKSMDGEKEFVEERKEDVAEETSKPESSESAAVEKPSSPASERSCKTSTSCGSLARKKKALKPPPRLAIFNWADLLPPPPVDPPPSSLGSPPPSPPFSERSAMTGMTGRTGMSGMSGMTGMSGITGMSGMTGHSGLTGRSGLTEPMSTSSPSRKHRRRDGATNDGELESMASKSEKSKKSRSKPKPIPIDLEGITSDIIMQWAESVTNTSGSEDDSSASSPSRISGISSDGSFFTDADFAHAVRVAAECGGFNTDAYGLMDSLGIPPPYATTGWKRSNSFSNDNEATVGTAAMYGPRPLRKRWETGSEGDLEYTPPARVRPRLRRDNEKGPNDTGPNLMRLPRGAPGELVRRAPGMRVPVPIVPSQPRRPLHRAARPGGPPGQINPGILVQPLKKTSTISGAEQREPIKKKYAIVKKIPQSLEPDKGGGYNSASMSSSKSSASTSTASTVKSSSYAASARDDSEAEENAS